MRLLPATSVLAALLVCGSRAAAERADVCLSVGWMAPRIDEAYPHTYVPRVAFDDTSGGMAGHTLAIGGASGVRFAGTVGMRVSERLGLQGLVTFGAHDLDGPSGPHAVRLEYTTRQPPDYLPRRLLIESREAWPAARGRLRQVVLGANLVVRARTSDAWTLDLSGGPTLHRVHGTLEGLAFTGFHLGGHGVLFSNTYRLGTDLPSTWVAGLDAGATVAVRLSPRVRLVIDGRWFRAGTATLQPTVARVLNEDEVLISLTPAEIAAQITLAPLDVRPSFAGVSVGMRVVF